MTNPLTASGTHIRKGPRCLLPFTLTAPHCSRRAEPGHRRSTRRTLGTPASFAAPAKTNGAERAKAHTTISSLSSAQQKAGFNRFVITYTDSALNAGGINWASPAGTQVATWSDALYSGISSDVKSIDNLLKVKTSYVRTTAQKATVVTLSSKLSAEPAEKYMAALSSNPPSRRLSPTYCAAPTHVLAVLLTPRSLRLQTPPRL